MIIQFRCDCGYIYEEEFDNLQADMDTELSNPNGGLEFKCTFCGAVWPHKEILEEGYIISKD